MAFKPFVLQRCFIVNSAQFLCFFFVLEMCSLKHSKTTPSDSHCTSPRHSQSQLPKPWSIYTSLAFQETISKRNWNTKIYWEVLIFHYYKIKPPILFLSLPSPTTAQAGNENQPSKYELFSRMLLNRFAVSWMQTYRSHFPQAFREHKIRICSHQPWWDKATEEGDNEPKNPTPRSPNWALTAWSWH